jgi:hypothetical protein
MMVLASVLPDLFRGVVLVEGGVACGLALSEAWLYYRRKRMPTDPWYGKARLDYMALTRLGIAILVIGMTMVVATRLGSGDLTFRSPIGFVAFTLLIIGMGGILHDDETMLDGEAKSMVEGDDR